MDYTSAVTRFRVVLVFGAVTLAALLLFHRWRESPKARHVVRGGQVTAAPMDAGSAAPRAQVSRSSAAGAAVPPAGTPSRRSIALEHGWKFAKRDVAGAEAVGFDDGAWTAVSLPHTWNALDGQDGKNDYYRGAGWYRVHVTVPATERGRRLYVEFDGANIVTDVYVNGTRAGQHRGGFARFRFDVTSSVKPGEDNLIAVRVSNATELSTTVAPVTADFTFFGGLYREARLVSVDEVHFDMDHFGSSGVVGVPRSVSKQSASVAVRASVTNAGASAVSARVTATLLAKDGSAVTAGDVEVTMAPATTTDVLVPLTVGHPHLWNGLADPYLYRLRLEMKNGVEVVDHVVEPLGFRTFVFDDESGFSLNGAHVPLQGVNKHQDRLNKGWAVSAADLDEDMTILRDLGANAVRLAHYQHAQHFYDLCDEQGVLVWAELPLVNFIPAGAAFADNAKQQLLELIRQNANHPSIVMWSLSNEVVSGEPALHLMTDLNALAHREDPARPTALATNYEPDGPITKAADLLGVNRYFGWYTGKPTDIGRDLDGAHQVAGRPLSLSEYGAGAGISIHTKNPTKLDHSEEYQSSLHEIHWKFIRARPYLYGSFVWNLFDFAVDGRDEGEAPGRNDKGLVTYDRKTKKDAFYWYKANWSTEPVVYITERRWQARPAGGYAVKIYSNAPSVTLVVNGVPQALRTASDHVFLWKDVELRKGPNTLAASAKFDSEMVTDTVAITGF